MKAGGYRRVRLSPDLAYRDQGLDGLSPAKCGIDCGVVVASNRPELMLFIGLVEFQLARVAPVILR